MFFCTFDFKANSLKVLNKRGLVYRSTGSWYKVKFNDQFVDARIKGKFRIKGIKTTNPIAVGDEVELEEIDGEYIIKDILARKNYIIRKSVNLSKQAHIIACNVDRALFVVTINHPHTSTGFIDRFLITAEAYHIPVTLVFNKIDLYDEKDQKQLNHLQSAYEKIGYQCIQTSATNGKGIEEVKQLLTDQTTLLSGHSGAGKSTLINQVDKELDVKTGDISTVHLKGKHTTTFAEMFDLSFGGRIIDTPGIKGLGLVDFDKAELSHYFLEMRERLHNCKFNNCQHLKEPGCAIKEALVNGEIEEFRYDNYLSMYFDEDENYRKANY